jgi:hypothetical protein
LMKVGDLVALKSSRTLSEMNFGKLGIVIKIAIQPQDDLDDLFPYLVHFNDGYADFFGSRHLEVISESR